MFFYSYENEILASSKEMSDFAPATWCLKRDAYFDFHEYPYLNTPNTACITRVRCSVPSMLSKGKPRTKVR